MIYLAADFYHKLTSREFWLCSKLIVCRDLNEGRHEMKTNL